MTINRWNLCNLYVSIKQSLNAINSNTNNCLLHVPSLWIGLTNFCNKRTNYKNEKSAQRRRKHSTLYVVRQSQKFSPRYRPPSRGTGWLNLFSWRWSLPSPTDPVWWRSMHAILSYRGNRLTSKQTHKQTHMQTGLITIHCAAKLSVQCNKCNKECADAGQRL